MSTKPHSSPYSPGAIAKTMCPSMTTMPEINSVLSAPPNPVGKPGAEYGGQINAAAVCADDAAGERLFYAQTAFIGSVIEIDH